MLNDLTILKAAVDRQHERVQRSGLTDSFPEMWLFTVALGALRRSAQLVADLGVPVTTALAAFDQAVPTAKQVRDVLEHLEDYELGIGDMQLAAPKGARPVEFMSTRSGGVHWALQLQGPAGHEPLDLQFLEAHKAATELATVIMPLIFEARQDAESLDEGMTT